MHQKWVEQSEWNVADLIKALQGFPQDAPISVSGMMNELQAVATDSFSNDVTLHLRDATVDDLDRT